MESKDKAAEDTSKNMKLLTIEEFVSMKGGFTAEVKQALCHYFGGKKETFLIFEKKVANLFETKKEA